MKLFPLVFLLLVLTGCTHSERTLEAVLPTESDPLLEFVFLDFGYEEMQGKHAILDVRNLSEYRIVNVRGEVEAFDSQKEKIYSFPWGSGGFPQFIKPNGKTRVRWGFEIPEQASSATFKLIEIEVVK